MTAATKNGATELDLFDSLIGHAVDMVQIISIDSLFRFGVYSWCLLRMQAMAF